MNWIQEAKNVFDCPRPEHFTNFQHCDECAEYDEILLAHSVDSIGVDVLVPWSDPLIFATVEGKKYYMPALIRLTIETIQSEFYLERLLCHLESNGLNNNLFLSCNREQRAFIVSFIEFVIDKYGEPLEANDYVNEAFRVHDIWSNEQQGCAV